jgi:hypothetical protein
MVEQINIEFLKNFREDFKDAVKELEEKHGIVIHLGNISYNNSQFTSKLEVRLDSVSPNQKYIDTFKLLYKMYGLDEDMLGKTFNACGKTLKFVGLDSKKRNYPCICEGNGKSYKLSVEQLKLHLNQVV